MDNYVGIHSSAQQSLSEEARHLRELSNALYLIGNEKLSDDLLATADAILKAKRDLNAAFDQCFNEYTGSVQQGTANMMNGILAMTKMIKDTSDAS